MKRTARDLVTSIYMDFEGYAFVDHCVEIPLMLEGECVGWVQYELDDALKRAIDSYALHVTGEGVESDGWDHEGVVNHLRNIARTKEVYEYSLVRRSEESHN